MIFRRGVDSEPGRKKVATRLQKSDTIVLVIGVNARKRQAPSFREKGAGDLALQRNLGIEKERSFQEDPISPQKTPGGSIRE